MLLAPLPEQPEGAEEELDENGKKKKKKKDKLDFDPKCKENSDIIKGVLRKIRTRKYKKKQLLIRDRRIDLLAQKQLDKSSEVQVLEDFQDKHYTVPAICEPGKVGRAVGKLTTEGIKGSIMFPREPYKVQETLMLACFKAVAEAKNAMLESPTGTGKTLCLLTSALEGARRLNTEYAKVRAYNREQREIMEKEALEEEERQKLEAERKDKEAQAAAQLVDDADGPGETAE